MTGTIKSISADRGFGFLTGADGTDYFFHRTDLVDGVSFNDLAEGDPFEFEPLLTSKGPRAAHVRRIAGNAPVVA